VVRRGLRQAEALARGPLVDAQPRGERIGDRSMCEEQLPRREAAVAVFGDAGTCIRDIFAIAFPAAPSPI
jgi:hypothetical protein